MSATVRTALAIVAFIASVTAANAQCECGAIPVEGTYEGSGTEVVITHLNGSAGQCPQSILIEVPRTEAPDASVALPCFRGGLYGGIEATRVGNMTWQVRAVPEGMHMALPEGLQVAANDLQISSVVEITLTPPSTIGATRTWRGTTSNTRAPECLCAEVRAEREFAADMVAVLNDTALQDLAEDVGMRGSNPNSRYTVDDDGVVTKFDVEGPDYAFMDIVSGIVNGGTSFTNGEIRIDSSDGPRASAQAAQAGSGEMLDTSMGDTDPRTCEVRVRQGSCTISVLAQAVRAHEAVHAETCRAQNSRDSFTWVDGSRMDGWRSYHDGMALPHSAYSTWTETVANIAQDEGAAYSAELPVYDAFLEAHCAP